MVSVNYDHLIDEKLLNDVNKHKTQIVITNTNCTIDEHLSKISLRYNKKYNKVPAYTIDKSGALFCHYDPKKSANFFEDNGFNLRSIVISLENIGWLDLIDDCYYDWRGLTYGDGVFTMDWRNKKHWAEYTNEQTRVLIELINYLCLTESIKKKFIGTNTFIKDADKFNGVMVRSNISKNYYDLTPAFDFDKLIEL
jgi:hypothetical protein